MSRVVLLGATGYTGGLAARALLARGAAPLLVGRNAQRLKSLAEQLGGVDYEIADAGDGASLRRLLGRGDVLATTAGPFSKLGAAQVDAAISARAHYLDSCAEPAFFRSLQTFDGAARAAGSAILTACAYDFFPGNAVADHVLQLAGPDAVRVDIGYFGDLVAGYRMSSGSQASGLATMLEPGLFWRNGEHVLEPVGLRYGQVALAGVQRPGLSMAGTEHLFLPPLYPKLRDVNAFWGWAGRGTRALQLVSHGVAQIAMRPWLKRRVGGVLSKLAKSDGSGPSDQQRLRSASYVCATAFDREGRELGSAELGDADGFDFTAGILAWAADTIARDGVDATGVTGPVQAFGRARLLQGHAEVGFELRGPDASAQARPLELAV
ncbi:MAG TPA: saccharopine dehydrogenase NADP-binding domain-containing protein [Polyangiales bacterium]|nr:saccharopine dehydrogenase NADP-binding domain-containing protein [Polyangiales bacterium]